MVLAGVADPRIYFCDIAACCSSAGRHGVCFGGGLRCRVCARSLCSGRFRRWLIKSATFVRRWKLSSREGKRMSPVAVWQVVCIVSVVSVQFSVESGCIAIKKSLSLNAAISSGPKKSFLCCQLRRETAEAGVETPSAASSAACTSPMFMELC